MFDFERWAAWLTRKAVEHEADGAIFRLGKPSAKPGMEFGIDNGKAIASFRVWITGETDYEVVELRSRAVVHHQRGMILDDTSFEWAFDDFMLKVAVVM